MSGALTGVLLMAYGTPGGLGEVEAYYTDIRGGRKPSPDLLAELTERYRRVGGKTPLLEITRQTAEELETWLNARGEGRFRVYVGMKHWRPTILEAVQRMAEEGVDRVLGLPLAPHFSEMSIGGYRQALEEALRTLPHPPEARVVESWHANPSFVRMMAHRVKAGLAGFAPATPEEVEVVFTAHSLPRKIQEWGDPYPEELRRSCEAVATEAGVTSWRFSYQSAGRTGDPWLGPDILETLGLGDLGGKTRVLLVPIGFTCDNLEVLFDLDIQARELAREAGLDVRRTPMPNATPEFIRVLEDVLVSNQGTRLTPLLAGQRG